MLPMETVLSGIGFSKTTIKRKKLDRFETVPP